MNGNPLQPLRVQSLKEACIVRLEGLILSGEWQIGRRLPAERELAAQLNISRPVLHEALVDLATKGLVSIQPRRGVYINDFRTHGSLALLSSLLSFHDGSLDPAFTQSLMDMRRLLEIETADQAARNRTPPQVINLEEIIQQESALPCQDAVTLTELDFTFHLTIAIASGNLVYPLIINSFKSVYTHLTGQFFRHYCQSPVIAEMFAMHREIVSAIARQDPEQAAARMAELLQHGEKHLKGASDHVLADNA